MATTKYLLVGDKFITLGSSNKLLVAGEAPVETYYLKTADGYYPTTSAGEKLLFNRGEE